MSKFIQDLCLVFALFHLFFLPISQAQLRIGFYSQTCPNAESIVKSVVTDATKEDQRVPPILLRLHFHDCFVEVVFVISAILIFVLINNFTYDLWINRAVMVRSWSTTERRIWREEQPDMQASEDLIRSSEPNKRSKLSAPASCRALI